MAPKRATDQIRPTNITLPAPCLPSFITQTLPDDRCVRAMRCATWHKYEGSHQRKHHKRLPSPDNARKQPLGRSMEAISHKHIFTEKSKLLPSKPYLCLHLFKNSKTPQTTCRQLKGSDSGGQSKRYTYEIIDMNIIYFRKKYNLINDLNK